MGTWRWGSIAGSGGCRDLLGLLALLCLPTETNPAAPHLLLTAEAACQQVKPVHESRGSAKPVLEASVLVPFSCTPKFTSSA